ncbi:MAG: monofunctional biosynthetic peptidoglycan transglycosylase [Bacteroidetes bacterium]|nr:monofunctional biosynthetic peptidoglycan transglycosylase [Bacteroidota bacterium]
MDQYDQHTISVQQEPVQPLPWKSLLKNTWLWVRNHPFRTGIIILALLLCIDFVTLPFGDIEKLKQNNPHETAFMRYHAERAKREGKKFRKKHIWVPLKSISSNLRDAVIVAEDGTFWSHEGFDWYEFKESLERDLEEFRAVRGASTITQQLVKNLFLSPSKNPIRKIKEWILTWYMERTLSKTRILELYLNLIEWGDGIYGAEAASRHYFGKSASELTREEAARLAAVIPNPRRFHANSDSRYIQRRATLILSRMEARGL